jgi:hypothetical protein
VEFAMTEAEWMQAKNSWPMLRFLEERNPSQRKIHLFVCACCRSIHWDALRQQRVQDVVLTAERFADGLATEVELRGAQKKLPRQAPDVSRNQSLGNALWAARLATGTSMVHWEKQTSAKALWAAKYIRGPLLWRDLTKDARNHVSRQCVLLRDIFAPFVTVAVQPIWLGWNGGTIPKLAQVIYDERRFADMPLLADALEEAGCADEDILSHCRQPGEHVRGCWVLDILLGKS